MILPVFNYSLTQWNVIAATWVKCNPNAPPLQMRGGTTENLKNSWDMFGHDGFF